MLNCRYIHIGQRVECMSEDKPIIDDSKGLSKKDLIDYVIKLNDRELSRSKTSGFTSWAILGAIGVLGWQVLEYLPLLTDTHNQLTFLLLFTSFVNLMLASIRLFIDSFNNFTSLRQLNVITKNNALSYYFLQIVMFCILILLNEYTEQIAVSLNISSFHYNLFNWAYTLILLFPTGYYIKTEWYKWRNNIKSNFVDYPMFITDLFWIIYFPRSLKILLSMVFVCLSGYSLYNINFSLILNKEISLLKLTFIIIAICFLFYNALLQYLSKIKIKYCEELERDLIIKDLSLSETKELIKEHFISQTLIDWVNKQKEEISANINIMLNDLCIAEKKISEMKRMNEFYKITDELEKQIVKHKTKVSDFHNKLTMVLRQPYINKYEREMINKIINNTKVQIEALETALNKQILREIKYRKS